MKNTSYDWLKLDNAAKIFPGQNSRSWSNIFRIGAQLKSEVDPQVLSVALKNTLRRIPSFNVRIRRGLFWYYFEQNPNEPQVLPDIKNPCYRIKFKENKGFLFRVFYRNDRINVEVYHALCDGYGAAVFLSTLVGEYLRLKGEDIDYNQFVLDVNEAPRASELEDSYDRYADSKVPYDRKDKWVYHATGTRMPMHISNFTAGIMSFK